MLRNMKTAIFDLGGVLIDFCHKQMCKQLANICDVEPERIHKVFFTDTLGELYEKGLIDSQYLYLKLCHEAKKPLNFADVMHAASAIFEPIPQTIDLLEELKSKGVRLLLLSNTCEAHFQYAEKNYPFLKKFDGFLLSYKVGMRKPDPKIFKMALCMANTTDCLYIDDVANHTKVAIENGLSSHHYTNPENLRNVLKMRRFI